MQEEKHKFYNIELYFVKMIKNSEKMKNGEKEIKEARLAVKKAEKEIREAEETTTDAQEEVAEATEVTKGKQKKSFMSATRDLEKAVYSVVESREATEEAEFKIKNSEK
ncbi:MAG TPA: hypothetical protein VMZ91_11815 [Candidatus Paceibacterota bacterium]|nr:hypothetical protein [Candidatus Paceibacterota bacterium]